jgi:hypothetical protein
MKDPKIFTKIGIFGLKKYHLATLFSRRTRLTNKFAGIAQKSLDTVQNYEEKISPSKEEGPP